MESKFKKTYNNFKVKTRKFFNHVYWVVLVVLGVGVGFGVGYYYKQMMKVNSTNKMKIVSKNETFIAIDEYQRFIIIEKQTGNYTIFDDSVGQKVFSMYARNIWGQHNNTVLK